MLKFEQTMIISIHQPAFMPWYPLIQKIDKCDIFVMMSNCQFERRGYQNRFDINGKWFTMSVKKNLHRDLTKISEVDYSNVHEDWESIKNRLPQYRDKLNYFDECISDNLVLTNKSIIVSICDLLNINTKIIDDYETELTSNERLIDICKTNNAETYLSGNGARAYIDEDLFNQNGINVIFQENIIKKHSLEIL